MKLTLKRSGEDRSWPGYIFGGRMRTSTAGLLLAFVAFFWINQHYQPASPATTEPTQQVVPPGFVPDPDYTWVPRTNVRPRESEFTTTPRTTTTTPTPTTTTPSPGEETTTSAPDGPPLFGPPTTVLDPDGVGPLSPQTFTQAPPMTSAPAATSVAPAAPTTLPPR